MFKTSCSKKEDLGLGLSRLPHPGTVLLVKLDTADWAAIIIPEPVLNTSSIESMLAGQFASKRTLLAGLETNVTI